MTPIPEIHVEGTHFEVGHAIGMKFKDMILGYVNEDKALNEEFLPFINTTQGHELYEGYLSTVLAHYPQYIDELQGMSDATGIPFLKFFTLMIRSEITSTLAIDKCVTEGCTDVYLKTKGQFVLGHNEDFGETHSNRIFIVHAVIHNNSENKNIERFTAVTAAGFSPGNTFGLLPDAGLCYTINLLCPTNVQPDKMPRPVLNRALLAAKDFDHLLEIANCPDVGCANGFSINVGVYIPSPELWTVEVAPANDNPVSIVKTRQFAPKLTDEDYYLHLNRYKLLETAEIPGGYVESTDYRLKRIMQLPVPVDVLGVRGILGDEEGDVHRLHNKNMPTGVTTLFTVIVDFAVGQIAIFKDNPKLTDPSNVFQLKH